jgi:RHH-type proline utilization regulon transcriptional repressor/proline dehydrogenase/delta 1-pyrroline-5-carboxylate dehydrogenase
VLHVYRYRAAELGKVLEAIRSTGFGLTLGVHSRLESLAEHAFRTLPVGNTYVNRNMIGAVVGVQPFGGQGLSGTGPKAGGPNYLQRFATERTLTINTAAIGGAVELLS